MKMPPASGTAAGTPPWMVKLLRTEPRPSPETNFTTAPGADPPCRMVVAAEAPSTVIALPWKSMFSTICTGGYQDAIAIGGGLDGALNGRDIGGNVDGRLRRGQ